MRNRQPHPPLIGRRMLPQQHIQKQIPPPSQQWLPPASPARSPSPAETPPAKPRTPHLQSTTRSPPHAPSRLSPTEYTAIPNSTSAQKTVELRLTSPRSFSPAAGRQCIQKSTTVVDDSEFSAALRFDIAAARIAATSKPATPRGICSHDERSERSGPRSQTACGCCP